MAWLLVQHADHDVEFQGECLELMKSHSSDDINIQNIAFLEDRIRVNKGLPQVYGTQFFGEGDAYGPRPIENPEDVDSRRLAMGLETIEEYKKILIEKYKKL